MADEVKPVTAEPSGAAPVHVDAFTQDTIEERRSSRNFKYWAGKVIVLGMVSGFLMLTLTWCYTTATKGTAMQSSVIESFLKTFTDVLNILFTSPSKT